MQKKEKHLSFSTYNSTFPPFLSKALKHCSFAWVGFGVRDGMWRENQSLQTWAHSLESACRAGC